MMKIFSRRFSRMNADFIRLNSRKSAAYVLLFLIAFSFRVFIALRLPNDEPDDGRLYAQLARNVLEQHVYAIESQAPYNPTLIRLPGYPLFLASITLFLDTATTRQYVWSRLRSTRQRAF